MCIVLIVMGTVIFVISSRLARDAAVTEPLIAEENLRTNQLHDTESSQQHGFGRQAAWALGAAAFFGVRQALGRWSGIGEVALCALGGLLGEMCIRIRREEMRKKYLRRTDYHLPNVMERVVMGVSAGLDVIPAMQEASRESNDPVSEKMREVVSLAEGGMPVSDALDAVSHGSESLALKHALVHLGIAYRQGGEIVKPLKELSDATQLHFQESVEEQIARLPVKAVMPLVLTFAGIIVCFLTVPLIQVGSITRRVADVAQQQR